MGVSPFSRRNYQAAVGFPMALQRREREKVSLRPEKVSKQTRPTTTAGEVETERKKEREQSSLRRTNLASVVKIPSGGGIGIMHIYYDLVAVSFLERRESASIQHIFPYLEAL